MRPKTKEKNGIDHDHTDKKAQEDLSRRKAEYEAFLTAFEKPTQIYRFLRARHFVSPIFLHRTLSYMNGRSNRRINTRKSFQIDSILKKAEAAHKPNTKQSYNSEFLNLTFQGFYSNYLTSSSDIDVEVLLVKKGHRRRKNSDEVLMEVSLGHIQVPCKVKSGATNRKSPVQGLTLSISNQHFMDGSGHKTYTLVPLETCSNDNDISSSAAGDEPASKKRRSTRQSATGEALVSLPMSTNSSSSKPQVTDLSPSKRPQEKLAFTAELTVYDVQHKCLLVDGEYELITYPQACVETDANAKTQWESAPVAEGASTGVDPFKENERVKFRLVWSKAPLKGAVECTAPSSGEAEFMQNNCIESPMTATTEELIMKADSLRSKDTGDLSKWRVFYQFLFNNSVKQQTEAKEDMRCPWCVMQCSTLYSLLKHLRLCHSRFNFKVQDLPRGLRIDVSINDCYDGSYAGNPQDLHSHFGFAYCRNGPTRRTPITYVFRSDKPKKVINELSEFYLMENEAPPGQNLVQGHNRLYFHTLTSQPVRPCEIYSDSEDEMDPEWLRQKTMNMIDEFTDVNEGEKEVMKMWNIHTMHHNYVGDYQLPIACHTFVEEYGPKIIQKGLFQNFVLHLTNLYDFGLIRPDLIQRTIAEFIDLQNSLSGSPKQSKREAQEKIPNKYMSPWVKYLPTKTEETQENDSQFDTDDDSQICECDAKNGESAREDGMESQS
ncbi:hypothetical protein CAPTEDRAFT_227135 [Capitella teleta]|uniref:Uncharacterized protein n=1 Tax=Capitella teleta TaxID=283909 RepID=R7UAU1_CAPTE|nr:hypothetical protein CAPTEDRAFT_227135 [Capitella teleta]|eukprot:ELU03450.1 hypothetical protein CAPTEDRAFT_227135 [Capitella teleta]